MTDDIKTGTVLMKEGALLPESLQIESEPCVPGWKLVNNLNGYALDRKVQEAGWTFFFQAGEIKSTVFGIDAPQMTRRAIERMLMDPKTGEFNSLEIARVTSVGSARFPGVHFLTVAANLRHIQQSLFLFREDARDSRSSGIGGRPSQDAGPKSDTKWEETSRHPDLAGVSNP